VSNRRETKFWCIDGRLHRLRCDVAVRMAYSCHGVCALCSYPLDRRVFEDQAYHNLARRGATSLCDTSKTLLPPLQIKSRKMILTKSRWWYKGVWVGSLYDVGSCSSWMKNPTKGLGYCLNHTLTRKIVVRPLAISEAAAHGRQYS
jgi:hypothetical protein